MRAPVEGGVRGRGAKSNRSGRFETHQVEDFDDGWELDDLRAARVETSLLEMKSKSIVSRNDSPDIGFDQSINPYVGCSHGCIYCYARPSHAYYNLSPGIDFESKIFFKPNAAILLEEYFENPRYFAEVIHVGGNTDPYQPSEGGLRITRAILEVMDRYSHPFTIITKNALILRDLDILKSMASRRLVRVVVSVTTLDRKLARAMEPRASTPERRLDALRRLSEAGVPSSVSVAPIIPGLTDHEIEKILSRAADAGAVGAHYVVLRLPLEISDLFKEWLAAEVPDRASRVLSLVRQMRGGKEYDSEWGLRMKGTGPIGDLIRQRFTKATASLDLNADRQPLRTDLFRRGLKSGHQTDLFR